MLKAVDVSTSAVNVVATLLLKSSVRRRDAR
jgi:hypothetical protein